jgi:hypothetical protein
MSDKITVSHRLDAAVVRQLDALADAEGLTRSAVIERLCSREGGAVRVVAPASWLRSHAAELFPKFDGDADPVLELVLRQPIGFEWPKKGKR